MNRKIGLDIARAIAVGLVLLSHLTNALSDLGFLGVELFFALSGYLIGGILLRMLSSENVPSWRNIWVFWRRRWWRTLPNYSLFLPIFVVFHSLSDSTPGLRTILPCLVFAQGIVPSGIGFYEVSWSLCIEEWFYLLFPLAIMVFCQVGVPKGKAVWCAVVVFILGPILLREGLASSCDFDSIRKTTFARLDAIIYGVVISAIEARYDLSLVLRRQMLGAGIASLVLALGLSHFRLSHFRLADVMLFVFVPAGFALMLPWLAKVETFPAYLGFMRPVIYRLSLWSYSIYLCHIPVFFLVYWAFGDLRVHLGWNLFSKAVGIALAVVVSSQIYSRFEVRLTAMRPSQV